MTHQQPTTRQAEILQQIEQFLRLHGRPPTRADLARALGLRNRQGIDQHLRALAAKGLLALEPGVARGLRLLPAEPSAATPRAAPVAAPRGTGQRPLPLYGRVAAGLPTLANSNVEDELGVDAAMFRPQADFLLRVHGESMRDAGIQDRDILAVHRTAEARNGQIVVARIGDEATVKYYQRRGDQLRLEPANAAFQPIFVDLRTQGCVIEGVVVGLIRSQLPHARR
jgi:repressor LexA